MVSKKICMVGDFGVGKSSTVARYVQNVFSEKYQTTVGVKIDTKEVLLPDGQSLKMVLWDIAGTDNLKQMNANYLRGAAGYLLIADGTRAETLETALELKKQIDTVAGDIPFVGLLNKADLVDDWEIPESQYEGLLARSWQFYKTSALDGANIEQAFSDLALKVIG